MAVSWLMLDKLMEVYASNEQSLVGELQHTIANYKFDIHQRTFNALKYRGYLEEYNPYGDDLIYYYRVTDRGIKYLNRYHKKRLESYELSKGYNKE